VAVATGLKWPSLNPKTGPMIQTWLLRTDQRPMDAARTNADDAVCGDCKLRGDSGYGRICYVTLWLAPNNVYRNLGDYPRVTSGELTEIMAGRHVRCGAYGDPAAIPFGYWEAALKKAAGWTGYTHQWRTCDRRFQRILMASVDTVEEHAEAQAAGWRTFRVRHPHDPLLTNEVICPASDEAGHTTTCEHCELCRGTANPARSVAIMSHGQRAAFFPSRKAAESRL
jgi:hypothetical protein